MFLNLESNLLYHYIMIGFVYLIVFSIMYLMDGNSLSMISLTITTVLNIISVISYSIKSIHVEHIFETE